MQHHSVDPINGAASIAHIEHHRHAGGDFAPQVTGRIKVALVGNPNVGKSLFFNYLSGMYVDVSNYPGTTIEFTSGRYKDFEIIDTPGVYGISSFSDEERVTREVVLQTDVILNIVDAAISNEIYFLLCN
jgi:ferrous iron transport protein B